MVIIFNQSINQYPFILWYDTSNVERLDDRRDWQ